MLLESSSTRFVLCLLVLAAFAVFFELGRQDVVTANEGQRAAPPAEMLRSGNFVVPTLNGKDYLAKPPLLYWAIACVYKVTGRINEWTARIPTAVAGLLLTLLAYVISRKHIGEKPARWLSLMLLASPYVLERSRWAELDVPLTLMTFAALWMFFQAMQGPQSTRTSAILLGSVCLAAAMLLKGPVPLLFLAMAYVAYVVVESPDAEGIVRRGLRWTIFAFALAWVEYALQWVGFLVQRNLNVFPFGLALFSLAWIIVSVRDGRPAARRAAIPLCLFVVLASLWVSPWLVLLFQQKSLIELFALIRAESLERTYVATPINSGTPFYYLIALPFMFAPWGFLFPWVYRRLRLGGDDKSIAWSQLTAALSVGLFSLIAGKEYEYILPITPLLLLPVAVSLTEWIAQESVLVRQWTRVCLPLVIVAAVGIAVYTAVKERDLLAVLEVGGGAVVVLGIAAGLRYGTADLNRRVLGLVLCTLLVILEALISRSFHYRGERSAKELATLCRTLVENGFVVEATKIYPDFTFYAAHPIQEVLDFEEILKKFSASEPYFYVTREKLFDLKTLRLDGATPVQLAKPASNKRLILLGNAAAKEALERLHVGIRP